MNLPSLLFVFRWLVRDTFRQARASGLCWLMLAVSAIAIVVCLSVDVAGETRLRRAGDTAEFLPRGDREAERARTTPSGVDVVGGEMTLLFGALRVPLGRDAADAVGFLELLLAGAVGDTAGILLILVWTAGFVPAFLDPRAAVVLLAKPVPRWSLLAGKYVGVLVFVAFQATVFVGGTWLALGLRTGYWEAGYLLCIPLLLIHFAVFYSFSVLLAVCTRGTIVCVVGSVLFWFLCWGMNYARHAVVAFPADTGGLPPVAGAVVEAGYWMLPKALDFNIVLSQALHAERHFATFAAVGAVQEMGYFAPDLSVLSSIGFAVVVLLAAGWELATTDY